MLFVSMIRPVNPTRQWRALAGGLEAKAPLSYSQDHSVCTLRCSTSNGTALLYCALSESLAMLELRAHSPHPYRRTRQPGGFRAQRIMMISTVHGRRLLIHHEP